MPTLLITGTSSGLGLAFLTHYARSLSEPISTHIHALDATPPPPSLYNHPNITFHTLDITSAPSLSTLATTLAKKEETLDLVIHCAGIRGLVRSAVDQHFGDVVAAETLGVMDRETMVGTFEVNTWGAFNVIRGLLPVMRRGVGGGAKVVVLGSRMGSIGANVAGSGYAYRASKAALNAVVKSFSVDVGDVVFLVLHPGRVETGLVGWKEEGAVGVEESVRDCVQVIQRAGLEMSGLMVDRWGKVIEW